MAEAKCRFEVLCPQARLCGLQAQKADRVCACVARGVALLDGPSVSRGSIHRAGNVLSRCYLKQLKDPTAQQQKEAAACARVGANDLLRLLRSLD